MFDPDSAGPLGVDSIAHIIQTALTPIFFLSGIASLLNVFASRLARVSDRSHVVASSLEVATGRPRERLEAELRFLQQRTRVLDAAVLLGTLAGGATCLAAAALFVGSLRDSVVSGLLYVTFGLALLFTSGALVAFMIEVLLASRGLQAKQEAGVRMSEARGREERRMQKGEADGSAPR
jgi:hypothetical protein